MVIITTQPLTSNEREKLMTQSIAILSKEGLMPERLLEVMKEADGRRDGRKRKLAITGPPRAGEHQG